jgi:hypothetical protein
MADEKMNADPSWGTFVTYMAMMVAFWFLVSKISVPHQSFYRILAHECRTQLTAAVGLTPGLDSNVTTAQGLDIKVLFADEASTKRVYLWAVPYCLVWGVVVVLLVKFLNKLPDWLKRHGKAIGFTFLLAIFSAIIFQSTWKLEYRAQLVQTMRGKDLPPQNDWDFGQATALMIWLVVVPEPLAVLTVICTCRPLSEIPKVLTDVREMEEPPSCNIRKEYCGRG